MLTFNVAYTVFVLEKWLVDECLDCSLRYVPGVFYFFLSAGYVREKTYSNISSTI